MEEYRSEANKSIKELIARTIDSIDLIYNQCNTDTGIEDGRIMLLIEELALLADAITTAGDENSTMDLAELNEKLSMLLNALKEKDYMMFGDILVYELKPLLEYWDDNQSI